MAKAKEAYIEWEYTGGSRAICPASDEELATFLRARGYYVAPPHPDLCTKCGKHYTTLPAQIKCRHGGQTWRPGSKPPACLKLKPTPGGDG